jgi:hypothetical protein
MEYSSITRVAKDANEVTKANIEKTKNENEYLLEE